jgi:hypothetical protein
MEKGREIPAFDIPRIEKRSKKVKTLTDLTVKDGVI